jgi:uncharacterized membrane protein
LPPGAEATAELIDNITYITLLLGIPKGNDGKDAEITEALLNEIIAQVISLLPPVKDVDYNSIYTYILQNIPAPIKGDKGDASTIPGPAGKNAVPLTITNVGTDNEGNTIITFSDGTSIKINKGNDGRNAIDGKDGKDAEITEALINEIIQQVISLLPPVKDGKDGKDAVVDYNSIYTYILQNIPAPIKGDKGDASTIPGPAGKDAVPLTITNTGTDNEGNTIITFSDGTSIKINKGNDGRNAIDGKDGKDAVITEALIQEITNRVIHTFPCDPCNPNVPNARQSLQQMAMLICVVGTEGERDRALDDCKSEMYSIYMSNFTAAFAPCSVPQDIIDVIPLLVERTFINFRYRTHINNGKVYYTPDPNWCRVDLPRDSDNALGSLFGVNDLNRLLWDNPDKMPNGHQPTYLMLQFYPNYPDCIQRNV